MASEELPLSYTSIEEIPPYHHTQYVCLYESVCVFERERRKYEGHLSFVALLRTQPGSWCVKLLGNDTQKLSLVLCSVAVRRADVHHLERERDADTERRAEERGTE